MRTKHLKNNSKRNIIIATVALVVILIGGVAFGAYKMNDNQVTNHKGDLDKMAKTSKAYDGSDDHNTKAKKKSTTTNDDKTSTTTTTPMQNSNSTGSTNSQSSSRPSTVNVASNNGVSQKANLDGSSSVLSSSSAKQMVSNMNLPAGNVTTNEPGSYTVSSGSDQYTIVQNGKTVTIYQSQPDANGNMQVVNSDIAAISN